MDDTVLRFFLIVLLSFIIILGVIFLVTDSVDAQEQRAEKFAVTYKFNDLTIKQLADLDKWLKDKHPTCEILGIDKFAYLRSIGVDSIKFNSYGFPPIPPFWGHEYPSPKPVFPMLPSVADSTDNIIHHKSSIYL